MEIIELNIFSIFRALHKNIFNKTRLVSICVVYYVFSPTCLAHLSLHDGEPHTIQEKTCEDTIVYSC
jgi:hypothetical protein